MRKLISIISLILIAALIVALLALIYGYFRGNVKVENDARVKDPLIEKIDQQPLISASPVNVEQVVPSIETVPIETNLEQKVAPTILEHDRSAYNFDQNISDQKYQTALINFYKTRRNIVDSVADEFAQLMISFGKEYDFNPLLIAAMAANISGLDATFENDEARKGIMGVSPKMLELAIQLGSFKSSDQGNLKDPKINLELAFSILKLLDESAGSNLGTLLVAYRSNLETPEQMDQNPDQVPATAKKYRDIVMIEFKSLKELLNNIEKTGQNLKYSQLVKDVFSKYGIKFANQIDVEQKFAKELEKIRDPELALAIYIANINNNKSQSGFYFSELELSKLSTSSEKIAEFSQNIEIGIAKLSDLITSFPDDAGKQILVFFIGKEEYEIAIQNQSPVSELVLSLRQKALEIYAELKGKPAPTTVSQDLTPVIDSANQLLNFLTAEIAKHVKDDTLAAELAADIKLVAEENGMDPLLLASIVQAESLYNSRAKSNEGKIGLLQIDPNRAEERASVTKLEWQGPENLLDPKYNLRFGVGLINFYLKVFSNKMPLALASHLYGPDNVLNDLETQKDLPAKVVKYSKDIISRAEEWKNELEVARNPKPVEPEKIVPQFIAEPEVKKEVQYFANSADLIAQLIADETDQVKNIELAGVIVLASDKVAVDSVLIAAIMKESSNFGESFSEKGVGLFNLSPERAQKIAQYSEVTWEGETALKKPEYSMRLAATFISKLMAKFDFNQKHIIAAFFSSPAKVAKAINSKEALPDEVNNKVAKVQKTYSTWREYYKIKRK